MTRLRGTAALAVLAALVAGVPWALVQFGNWPIHGVPTGEQLRDLGDAVVSDTAVFAVLTVAAWAVWSVFLASLLVEVVAVARGVQAPGSPSRVRCSDRRAVSSPPSSSPSPSPTTPDRPPPAPSSRPPPHERHP
ncbi:MAG: hypothetical protein M5T61_16025 [Acidimicrobiia bacterium]|nr:hypothetical protein [Acidimicrobiia bacterium]